MARRKQPEAEAPGDKPVRINMVFQRSIYDYISVACGIEGKSMTQFVNDVLEQHRQDHREEYLKKAEQKL